MSAPCLLLIDWQNGFQDSRFWGPRNNPEAEANTGRLLEAWRSRDWPVIFVRHDSIEPASPLRPGQSGNDFLDSLAPRREEPVYVKHVNSAFIGTGLEEDLRARQSSRLVFCGISTDHCVSTSVRMAANLGFDVMLVGYACYTFDRLLPDGERVAADTIHAAHLASLHGEFARVVNTGDLIRSSDQTG